MQILRIVDGITAGALRLCSSIPPVTAVIAGLQRSPVQEGELAERDIVGQPNPLLEASGPPAVQEVLPDRIAGFLVHLASRLVNSGRHGGAVVQLQGLGQVPAQVIDPVHCKALAVVRVLNNVSCCIAAVFELAIPPSELCTEPDGGRQVVEIKVANGLQDVSITNTPERPHRISLKAVVVIQQAAVNAFLVVSPPHIPPELLPVFVGCAEVLDIQHAGVLVALPRPGFPDVGKTEAALLLEILHPSLDRVPLSFGSRQLKARIE